MRVAKLLMAILLVTEWSSLQVRADEPARSSADVFRSWEQRARALKTGRLTYAEQKFLAGSSAEGIGGIALHPPLDSNSENQLVVTLDPTRMHYEFQGSSWSPQEKRMVGYVQQSTFDGKAMVLYFPPPAAGERGDATITANEQHPDAENLYIKAVLLAFRPFDERLTRIQREDYMIVDDPAAVVEDRRCTVLTGESGGLTRTFWTDPTRDDCILKYMEFAEGVLAVQLQITYRNEPVVGWIPDGWKADWFNRDGTLAESSTARLQTVMINEPLSDADFQIEFAPGTLVSDQRTGTHSVIKADGRVRAITPQELPVASYEELMATESGQAVPGRSGPRTRTWLFVLNLVAATVVVIAVLVWGWRGRRPV